MFLHQNLIAFSTIIRNEAARFMRMWSQTLLPSVITTALYFLIFGSFIGSQLQMIEGHSYVQYIAPGLIMMTVITNSYLNVVSSVFLLKFQRSIEELLVAPIPNYLMLLGFTIGGILRGVIVGILVFAVALFFTHFTMHSYIVTFCIIVLTSSLFSLAGFTNAIYAKKFDDIQIVPTFVLTPLTYLGGIFYSIYQLPPMWQWLSKINPILYLVNTFRYGILGSSDVSISIAFSMTIVVNILLFSYNLYLLNKGVGIKT